MSLIALGFGLSTPNFIDKLSEMALPFKKLSRVAFLSPHPDDVELCCGIMISRLLRQGNEAHYYCVTNGAPRLKVLNVIVRPPANMTRSKYAAVRRKEATAALGLMALPPECMHFLDFPDLETYKCIESIIVQLVSIVPFYDTIVCCPFEGGHPDHDIIRFALAVACEFACRRPQVIEYSSYNAKGYQCFLDDRPRQVVLRATRTEQQLKRRIMHAFTSQRDEAVLFRDDLERYRIKTRISWTSFCQYSESPHYERFAYGGAVVTSAINSFLSSSVGKRLNVNLAQLKNARHTC